MQAPSSHAVTNSRPRRLRVVRNIGIVALAVVVLGAGCGGNNSTGTSQLPTPIFGQLSIPDPSGSNQWIQFATINPPPAEVLPTRGRAVRFWYQAPVGSIFAVSIRELATSSMPAVTTPLTQNNGTPAPPEAGYFQILSENPNTGSSQAIYNMYVRAPMSLTTNPANFDILVVNQSQRSNATDSSPMVVALRARKIYTVSVAVTGNGLVVSDPPGIQCGTSLTGHVYTDCTNDFGPGSVRLDATTHADPMLRFLEWRGSCSGSTRPCVLMLDGTARSVVSATFVADTSTATASTCSAAPPVSGWRWIGIPGCGPIDTLPGVTVQCDSQGYFCCSTGSPASTRCSGQKFTLAACNKPDQRNASLIQPGGCYEVDSFP